jgi:NAD(P)-dependent dehydrogenase (short-subunit alcohol dehydrogenase family)
MVEAFSARDATVTALGRDRAGLARVAKLPGVSTVEADVTDPATAVNVLREVRPSIVVLNAGAQPNTAPIHEQTWEGFSAAWNTDVKAGLHWIQAAIRLPLEPGSRVLIASSGAAVAGSPMSGGYAGAKRMLWFMAQYANGVSTEQRLGIRFQALLLMRMIEGTGVGDTGARAYATKRGVSTSAFFAQLGGPMSPRDFGERVATILVDPAYEASTALAIREGGIEPMDGNR